MQADNSPTCHVPDFIHSIAAQLCQAPQLRAYKEYLHNEPHILVSQQSIPYLALFSIYSVSYTFLPVSLEQ